MLRKAILLGAFLVMVVCACVAAQPTYAAMPSNVDLASPNNMDQASPNNNVQAAATAGAASSSTAPSGISINAKGVASANAVSSTCYGYGVIATQYWTELVPIPPPRRLDLFVTGGTCPGWKVLSNPSDSTLDLVQDAFTHVPNQLKVRVWYTGNTIIGLVVDN